MGKMNNQAMKENNLQLLLNTIRREKSVARSTLARELELTSPAVTNIVSPLIQQGILREGASTQIPHGRRPVLLELNPDACRVLGMVLTTETAAAVVTDFSAHILCLREQPITPQMGKERILDTMIRCAGDCMEQVSVKREDLLGLGIAAPGPLDIRTGTMINPPNFADWNQVPICRIMEEALGVPAVLDKETNAAALAEYYFNGIENPKTSFYISLFQNSIGGSLVLDGRILHGFRDGAGEIGHMQVDPNGPRCSCGHYGCLESVACGNALLEQVRKSLRAMAPGTAPLDPDTLTLEQIFQESSPLCQNAVDHSARMIAAAIGNLAAVISPSLVTLGGTLPLLSPGLVDQIRTYVHQRPYPGSVRSMRIEPSVLGEDGIRIGAAMLALNAFQTRLCTGA